MALCVEMLISARLAKNETETRTRLQRALDNGTAAEIFGRMVAAQGGPVDFVGHCNRYLPTAMLSKALCAERAGFFSGIDTRALGMTVVAMGGGRCQASDAIDYRVELMEIVCLGDRVDAGHPLAVINARDETSWQKAAQAAMTLNETPPTPLPAICRRISE